MSKKQGRSKTTLMIEDSTKNSKEAKHLGQQMWSRIKNRNKPSLIMVMAIFIFGLLYVFVGCFLLVVLLKWNEIINVFGFISSQRIYKISGDTYEMITLSQEIFYGVLSFIYFAIGVLSFALVMFQKQRIIILYTITGLIFTHYVIQIYLFCDVVFWNGYYWRKAEDFQPLNYTQYVNQKFEPDTDLYGEYRKTADLYVSLAIFPLLTNLILLANVQDYIAVLKRLLSMESSFSSDDSNESSVKKEEGEYKQKAST